MAELEKKPVKIVETILRDAHQSQIATRMTTEQMLPIVDKLDKVGYHAVECWGGATFDASLRFLHEDPWERLRKLRDGFKNTKLQMLFRGQNILGYRPYADDVVEYFVQKSAANGIDIIRIFDCLNDLRNLQTAVHAANKEHGHAQVALSYTLGDAYTLEYWTSIAKRIEEMGADSICIKDMAGLLVPQEATKLVEALKEADWTADSWNEFQKVVEEAGYIPVSDVQAYAGTKPEGSVVVGGSSSVAPVMEKLVEAYKKVNPNANVELQSSDSTTGMTSAIEGSYDIGMASRELKDEEKEKLEGTVIATDGIAVIVNKANPTEEMTSDQVKSIYLGDVLTWDEIAE
mgnify:CR=1 FL=1